MAHASFARTLTTSFDNAIADAQTQADANGAPVGVWTRDLWYTVCETPPDMLDPDPEREGWQLWAIVDPSEETA